jgi:hypothetical protein
MAPRCLARWIPLLTAFAACDRGGAPVPDRADSAIPITPDAAVADTLVRVPGCADGTRESFLSPTRYPRIAGCGGGFRLPGLAQVTEPACGRRSGNSTINPTGLGCNASDLCEEGWHLCAGANEVAALSPDGCGGAADGAFGTFFATRQSGPGCGLCARGTETCEACMTCGMGGCRKECQQNDTTLDDFWGCGDLGYPADPSCAPLNRSGGNHCDVLPRPWSCPTPDGLNEAATVRKAGPEGGGVLCCAD